MIIQSIQKEFLNFKLRSSVVYLRMVYIHTLICRKNINRQFWILMKYVTN